MRGKPASVASSHTMKRRSASRKGSAPRNTAFTRLKMAVLPPIPMANVATAVTVKPALTPSILTA